MTPKKKKEENKRNAENKAGKPSVSGEFFFKPKKEPEDVFPYGHYTTTKAPWVDEIEKLADLERLHLVL